ncbi:E3 ubiquitin-protein like [Melia azedarach]|uniref:E3 ubiquitin-protein like n=1 Tax=Melia azedarach TaxID=155640 RepID=A0ACC1WWV9_MELAZ|nr:E3 ubiquitin-protein like [Melia azedarach]
MATSSRVLVLILVILLSTLCQFWLSTGNLVDTTDSYSSSYRNLLALQRKSNQIPSCSEMVSRSQCSQNPRCRWCRSEALDDMCFSKTEAWRLPQQVFTCDS